MLPVVVSLWAQADTEMYALAPTRVPTRAALFYVAINPFLSVLGCKICQKIIDKLQMYT